LSREAVGRLLAHDFPGNVRELENSIERATALAEGDIVGGEIIPDPGKGRSVSERLPASGIDLDAELNRIEHAYILQALERAEGVKISAAKLLGMSFRSFRYRAAKLGISAVAEETSDERDPVEK
jgi:two-component system response regulator PilR (NtrC family)